MKTLIFISVLLCVINHALTSKEQDEIFPALKSSPGTFFVKDLDFLS